MGTATGLKTLRALSAPAVAFMLAACGPPWISPPARATDPYAQAVIDSVAHPPPTTPRQMLSAAMRTAAVEAGDAAVAYTKQLADTLTEAGDSRADILVELGDGADQADLLRLQSLLATQAPALLPVIDAIREAARSRLRDPDVLTRAVEDLRSPSFSKRAAAATILGRAGIDALPTLVECLASDDAAGAVAREVARGLVREIGEAGRQPLLDRLGSADIAAWPGVIAALDALDDESVHEFLLAPAVVVDTPAEVRDRALSALRHLHERHRGTTRPWSPPTRGEAVTHIVRRLDAILSSAPSSDHGDEDPAERARRGRDALHLARDLMAIGGTEPETVRLVILARLEALVSQSPLSTSIDIPPGQLTAMLTGPDGIDLDAVADVLDLAASRGLVDAATAAARGLEEALLPPERWPADPSAPLPPHARRSLVRALAVPDAELQFTAARTLALTAGPPPYAGSSRVVSTLAHAATATGRDRVVVAHQDAEIALEIAAGVSRFGYVPECVSTGRAAIRAAREHADTVLVILGARIILPSAYETTQFIQEQPYGDIPPVFVVIDPLDDEARGRFLTKSILTFSDVPCVAIVDRMEGFFKSIVDPEKGGEPTPARFPEALARLVGQQAASADVRATRARRRQERGLQAATLLAILERRGWEIPDTARSRLDMTSARHDPAQYNRAAVTPSPTPSADAAHPESTR